MTYCIMVVNFITYVLNTQLFYIYFEPFNLPTVNQSKYLRIIIREYNCAPDMKRQTCKLYANHVIIIRKFSKCSADVKGFLIQSYCSNLHCSIGWYYCSKTALKTMRIAYNNSLRKLLGIPK